MTDHTYTALVLAGSRRGSEDVLAKAGNVSHKCFIDVAGKPMLNRVITAVAESGRIDRIIVSIDEDSTGEARKILAATGYLDRISFVSSEDSIASSVMAVTQTIPGILPLVVTTGDNALHTPEMVRFFCDGLKDVTTDVALGVTSADVLLAKYPDGQRAFHRFRDGEYSSCNIYALLNEKALLAPRAFDSGGQFGKKPWRVIAIFGITSFLLYKSHLATLKGFVRHIARALHVTAEPVLMPFAEGPIDVDRIADWEKANTIISARETASSSQ